MTITCTSCGKGINALPNMKTVKCKHCGTDGIPVTAVKPETPSEPPIVPAAEVPVDPFETPEETVGTPEYELY